MSNGIHCHLAVFIYSTGKTVGPNNHPLDGLDHAYQEANQDTNTTHQSSTDN